ncbi:MAG: zinc ribbon domain-containing protein [Christensenellales bacterium]|jgi:predicted  nucleic acid-binding Zn-ribbon protein
MSKLSSLWDYQQADMELLSFESKIKNSEVRRKLGMAGAVLKEGQAALKGMEKEALDYKERISDINDEYTKLQEKFDEVMKAFEEADKEDISLVRSYRREAEEVQSQMTELRKELASIQAFALKTERSHKALVSKMGKARNDYVEYKDEYEKLIEESEPELKRLKGIVANTAAKVDKQQLQRYKYIRQNLMPPMAVLNSDQCMGCNMSLPSTTARRLKDNDGIIECENCGRILYMP